MPQVNATLEYLQNLPLYGEEKPYWCFFAPREGLNLNVQRLDNLEFEARENIPINDLRHTSKKADINEYGFQVVSHLSKFSSFDSSEKIKGHRVETEQLLKNTLGSLYVKCYDLVLRKNVVCKRDTIDLGDTLHIEGPARGVHNITYVSGPTIINRYMSEEAKEEFLKPGYRARIINTWRTLVPVLEDRPLALCDSRSVDPEDLFEADRVIPGLVGEVYYLTYNAKHKWFWLEKQTPAEPFIFMILVNMLHKVCPHVSFINPNALDRAAPRESIETRSIVITKE
ncbi:hypothetical protein DL95DRAFT_489082 [Leptodontidium sp. 2 PMI_412]|nr:hypothetical protein DL95DRAFT_489082 [Leptodontidium sp. 2 PMI_412]